MSKTSLSVAALLILAASAGGGYYYTHPCVVPGYWCDRADTQAPRYVSFQPAWLQQSANILYPAYALYKELEGSTTVALTVGSDGKLLAKKVKISSGVDVLDEAALSAADSFVFNVAAFGEVVFPYTKDLKVTFKL